VIELHRLHGNGTIVVNADLVETVEATPDTVITLVTKRRFVVEDSVEDVLARIVEWRSRVLEARRDVPDHSTAAVRTIHALPDDKQAAS
jgi:flagellar protein FlbD